MSRSSPAVGAWSCASCVQSRVDGVDSSRCRADAVPHWHRTGREMVATPYVFGATLALPSNPLIAMQLGALVLAGAGPGLAGTSITPRRAVAAWTAGSNISGKPGGLVKQ